MRFALSESSNATTAHIASSSESSTQKGYVDSKHFMSCQRPYYLDGHARGRGRGRKGARESHSTNQDHAKQGTTSHGGFACKRRDTATPGRQKRRHQGPSKSTSRDIEARSPLLDATDIITTEPQEIENVERHRKLAQKKPTQIRFSLDGELSTPHNKEMMVHNKSILLTTGPHTSKAKESSDQPRQMGIRKVTHDDFPAV